MMWGWGGWHGAGVGAMEVVNIMWGRCGWHGGGEYDVGLWWDPWRW